MTSLHGDRLKAVTINGRCRMYWGEHQIRLAWSTDLTHWQVVEDAHGKAIVALDKRPGYFDCPPVEPGPPAILTDAGIVLLYNARNDGHHELAGLGACAYSCGQALFYPMNPSKLLARLDEPFFRPEREFERTGQYGATDDVHRGLVHHRGVWWPYYGYADSLVAVATWNPQKK